MERQDKGDGIHIGGDYVGRDKVSAGGDYVGRDKITTTTQGIGAADMAKLIEQFARIQQKIDARPQDPNVDKAELEDTVKKIKDEVLKGELANPNKVERWLGFLAEMADDIFQVTAATLSSPLAGLAKAIQLIAQKAKEKDVGG